MKFARRASLCSRYFSTLFFFPIRLFFNLSQVVQTFSSSFKLCLLLLLQSLSVCLAPALEGQSSSHQSIDVVLQQTKIIHRCYSVSLCLLLTWRWHSSDFLSFCCFTLLSICCSLRCHKYSEITNGIKLSFCKLNFNIVERRKAFLLALEFLVYHAIINLIRLYNMLLYLTFALFMSSFFNRYSCSYNFCKWNETTFRVDFQLFYRQHFFFFFAFIKIIDDVYR